MFMKLDLIFVIENSYLLLSMAILKNTDKYRYIYQPTEWVECSLMTQETELQPQVESHQRLKI